MSERHTIEVARTARYHVLGGEGEPREAFLVLHGYAQLAGPFLDSCRALARPGRVLVAPEALSRFYLRRGTGEVGATWMTKEERGHEIRDNVRYLDAVARELRAAHPGVRALSALGFSQGGATAARWALLGESRLERVVLWGCPFPPDLEPSARCELARSTRWTLVLGERDETISRDAVEEGAARLAAAGAEPERLAYPGGHALDDALLASL